MEQKRCKKCQRLLPDGYKYNYCEHCRDEQAEYFRDSCKSVLGIAVMIGGAALAVITKGKINPNK